MMKLFAQRILAVLFAAACVGCAQDDVDEPTSGSEDIGRNPKIIYSSRGASAGELLVKFHPDVIGRLEQGVTARERPVRVSRLSMPCSVKWAA